MKIAILGYSGSGKSTLARALGERYFLPVLHLDRVHWAEGWTERNSAEEQRILADFLDRNADWIIDGNYSDLLHERRLEEADRIVLLLFGRFACLLRVFRRWRRYRGRSRPDIAEGCEEKLDADFVLWILFRCRNRKRRRNFEGIAARFPEKTVLLRSQRALDRWLQNLDSAGEA